jgi:hypothetical protein
MKRLLLIAAVLLATGVPSAFAYVEAPYTLGRVCHESSNILHLEVTKVNKEKGLIYYKKLTDLKGKDAAQEFKHNIGKRGFNPREWQTVMNWAEVGKKAIMFHNGGASETCIGDYWYQCYKEGEWWGMSHAEPFLLRSFCGETDALAKAVVEVVANREVVVPCFVDANREQMHVRKGKLQRLKVSLKRLDYNAKRDFVAFGADGDVPEFKTTLLIAESTAGWKFLPAEAALNPGTVNKWFLPDFDDSKWRTGQAPVGYGEDEIIKRKGTVVKEEGVPFVFRRSFDVPGALLTEKGVAFRLCVASDDSADVYINGVLADRDPEADHEFAYWNRDVEVPAKLLRPGRNVVAAFVRNHKGSSDIYLDMEISAAVPVPKKPLVK